MKQLLALITCFTLTFSLSLANVRALSYQPFYGIWISATKSLKDANSTLKKVRAKGFNKSKIYTTTEWSNLNNQKYYVISTNQYKTKSSAKKALFCVKQYYKGAFIKYTGNYKGKIKYTKLPDGWYSGIDYRLGKMEDSKLRKSDALIKSIKFKKINGQYYAVITGQLNYGRSDDTTNTLRKYKNATQIVPLSNKCTYMEDESPNPTYYTREEMSKQLPGVETRIKIENYKIVKIITSA